MNTTKMHYLCMKVGPTMECGDPPRPYLDIAQGRKGKPKCIPMLASPWNHRNQLELETHHGLFTTIKTQFNPNNLVISPN